MLPEEAGGEEKENTAAHHSLVSLQWKVCNGSLTFNYGVPQRTSSGLLIHAQALSNKGLH
ncbi:rCG30148, partial [Rattus norvegicus]